MCTNFYPGGDFFGAVLANESYLIDSQSSDKNSKIINENKKTF